MTALAFLRRIFGLENIAGIPTPKKESVGMDEAMVEVAEELASERIRETSTNQGPGIARFWAATSYPTGYKDRQPWCAATLAWIVREAAKRTYGATVPFRLPTSARVLDWIDWARENKGHWQLLSPAKSTVMEGDIVGWDFNGDEGGGTHIGLATSDERKDGRFDTAEGNTNAAGSRDGNGFYLKDNRTRKSAIFIIRSIG